jgi:hypothetical protein
VVHTNAVKQQRRGIRAHQLFDHSLTLTDLRHHEVPHGEGDLGGLALAAAVVELHESLHVSGLELPGMGHAVVQVRAALGQQILRLVDAEHLRDKRGGGRGRTGQVGGRPIERRGERAWKS